MHFFLTNVFPSQPHEYINEEIKIYEFCYDANRQKVLFAHHRLSSPKLLFSKLLHQERAVEYPMMMDDAFPLSNYEEIQKVVAKVRYSYLHDTSYNQWHTKGEVGLRGL